VELMGGAVGESEAFWTAPRREMIDPAREVGAKIEAVRGGLLSLSDAIRENGEHPFEQLAEIAEDNKLIDKLGLILDSDPRRVNRTGASQVSSASTDTSGKTKDSGEK
jgi:capsid protein